MIGILITPLVVYVLLFLLPVFYDEIPQRKAGLVAGILYTLFPLPLFFLLHLRKCRGGEYLGN